jgi:hypothetical protein
MISCKHRFLVARFLYFYFYRIDMSTSELNTTKKELVNWIESLKDDTLVGLLNSVKLSIEGKTGDWWDELTESDRVNILAGIRDFEQGGTMSSKDFWNGLANG